MLILVSVNQNSVTSLARDAMQTQTSYFKTVL